MPLLLPHFLSKNDALFAMREVAKFATALPDYLKRDTFHIVMIVPAMETIHGCYPNYNIIPQVLAEYTHGDKVSWGDHDFQNIAQCKTLQAWHGRTDGKSDANAHLLYPGDTPYFGSVFRDQIACGCSGVQPCFDKMISGMVIDMCVAIAQNNKRVWMEANPGMDFLPG